MSDLPAVQKPERTPLKMGERGFDFDFDGAWRFAQGLIAGGMAPKGVENPGAVVGLIEAGRELGLPPMYALANLTFTNGRLGIMGDAAKALVRRSGLLEPGTDFDEVYSGEEGRPSWTCEVFARRRGMADRVSRSFSIQDAIRAGLVDLRNGKVMSRKGRDWIDYGPWSTYTKRMLMYRATGFLIRDYFADAIGGAVVAEELRDYPNEPPRVIGARAETPPAEPDPLLPSSAPEPPAADVEIDPDTGDVIPDDVGRQGELIA